MCDDGGGYLGRQQRGVSEGPKARSGFGHSVEEGDVGRVVFDGKECGVQGGEGVPKGGERGGVLGVEKQGCFRFRLAQDVAAGEVKGDVGRGSGEVLRVTHGGFA